MAELSDGPDYTLLWNRFEAVRQVGDYVVGISAEGVAVSQYDSAFGEYVNLNALLMDERAVEMRVFDDLLVVKTISDSLIVFDVSDLPELSRLGRVYPGTEFDDFVLHDGDLYISVYFDGVWRFVQRGNEDYEFADSVMLPILCTQMHVTGDTLLILDEYNGIARYDVGSSGFGRFMDYLWIPFRVSSFFPFESGVLISGINTGVYLGEFGLSGSGIVSSLGDIPAAETFYAFDTLMVLIQNRVAYLRHRYTYDSLATVMLGDGPIDGDVVWVNNEYNILLPGNEGGLVLYSLEHIADPQEAFRRPGPIRGLALADGHLFSGGTGNPLDVYDVSGDHPYLEFTLGSNPETINAVTRAAGYLVVLFGGSNRLTFIGDAHIEDSSFVQTALTTDFTQGTKIEFFDQTAEGEAAVILIQDSHVRVYTLHDSAWLEPQIDWDFGLKVTSAAVLDEFLVVATTKGTLMFYRMGEMPQLTYLSSMAVGGSAGQLLVRGGRLASLQGQALRWISLNDPSRPTTDTIITLALDVWAATVFGDRLYTVGGGGVAIYDFATDVPELIDCGGMAGKHLAVDSNMIATSNGGSIHLYSLTRGTGKTVPQIPGSFTMLQNYPNPFNAATTIEFSLNDPGQVTVDVFNLLGRRVTKLADRTFAAGRHSLRWNGTTRDGQQVASGVYFYRLSHGGEAESRKMILIK
jgi:hypothetical protein